MNALLRRLQRRFVRPLLLLAAVMVVGTIGYRIIGGATTTLVDAVYMTFITIATIGYTEVIDLTHSPVGRIFTIVIAVIGIANVGYLMSAMTVFILEGELNAALRRRRMLKMIESLTGHYILCGIGRVGGNVAHELTVTGRKFAIIENDHVHLDGYLDEHPDTPHVYGDAAEDELLRAAGVERAAGVFAVTGDDAKNLVITLSVKSLNPQARVVARCHEVSYVDKIRRVGADAIVSPDYSGAMQIAASMIRPQAASFVDEMLRDQRHIRVEELAVPPGLAGRALNSLSLSSPECLLVAIRNRAGWRFNPSADYSLEGGDTLVVMASASGRSALEARLAG